MIEIVLKLLSPLNLFDSMVIIAAVISSAIVKTGVGVGAGIFLLPLLSLVLPPKTALALGAPSMLISDLTGLKLYWGEWNKKEALLIIPPALLGVFFGTIVIDLIPSDVFKFGIGVFAVAVATQGFLRKSVSGFLSPLTKHSGEKTGMTFGFLGGFVSAISHAGGAVISIYLLGKQSRKREFVGLFILFFVITNTAKMAGYISIGILTPELILLALILSPGIVFGSYFGNVLNKRIPQDVFRTVVLGIILITGLKLLLS